MPRSPGQPNNPVLRGEDAQEALHALADREARYAGIILVLGQRILGLEGVGLRNGMERNPDGTDMDSYAIAFTYPPRNINFVGFLTNQQDWRPGTYPQGDFGIRIRYQRNDCEPDARLAQTLLYGPTSESSRRCGTTSAESLMSQRSPSSNESTAYTIPNLRRVYVRTLTIILVAKVWELIVEAGRVGVEL